MKPVLTLLLTLLSVPAASFGQGFELRYERLVSALAGLNDSDRAVVDQAVELIKKGDGNIALTRLNTLNGSYPMNSSLRVLTAYALLQAGNLLGAYDEAKKAEATTDSTSYKCWFLAKVAFINGDTAACKRELKHASGDAVNKPDIAALQAEMKRKGKR